MKKVIAGTIGALALFVVNTPVFAQNIGASTLNVTSTIGNITTISSAFVWIFNTLRYFGWAGVIVGVGMAIFGLIYKLINSESEDAMKKVQSYVTKAVLIVVAGILLISSGFIVENIALLFGLTVDMNTTVASA